MHSTIGAMDASFILSPNPHPLVITYEHIQLIVQRKESTLFIEAFDLDNSTYYSLSISDQDIKANFPSGALNASDLFIMCENTSANDFSKDHLEINADNCNLTFKYSLPIPKQLKTFQVHFKMQKQDLDPLSISEKFLKLTREQPKNNPHSQNTSLLIVIEHLIKAQRNNNQPLLHSHDDVEIIEDVKKVEDRNEISDLEELLKTVSNIEIEIQQHKKNILEIQEGVQICTNNFINLKEDQISVREVKDFAEKNYETIRQKLEGVGRLHKDVITLASEVEKFKVGKKEMEMNFKNVVGDVLKRFESLDQFKSDLVSNKESEKEELCDLRCQIAKLVTTSKGVEEFNKALINLKENIKEVKNEQAERVKIHDTERESFQQKIEASIQQLNYYVQEIPNLKDQVNFINKEFSSLKVQVDEKLATDQNDIRKTTSNTQELDFKITELLKFNTQISQDMKELQESLEDTRDNIEKLKDENEETLEEQETNFSQLCKEHIQYDQKFEEIIKKMKKNEEEIQTLGLAAKELREFQIHCNDGNLKGKVETNQKTSKKLSPSFHQPQPNQHIIISDNQKELKCTNLQEVQVVYAKDPLPKHGEVSFSFELGPHEMKDQGFLAVGVAVKKNVFEDPITEVCYLLNPLGQIIIANGEVKGYYEDTSKPGTILSIAGDMTNKSFCVHTDDKSIMDPITLKIEEGLELYPCVFLQRCSANLRIL